MSNYQIAYIEEAPERAEFDRSQGFVLLEFGTNWCGHCQAAQAAISAALDNFPTLPHRKIEDGPGRKLGRSYRVKLWPTLILLKDGKEVARIVRPTTLDQIIEQLALADPGNTSPSSFEEFKANALQEGFDEVIERQWPPNEVLDIHTHPFAIKAVLVAGEMWLSIGTECQHLRPGDVFSLDANIPHAEKYGGQGAIYWVARRHL